MPKTKPKLVDFAKLKERVNIEQIAQHYGLDLKRQGESLVGSCPFCGGSEDSRKFKVTPSKGIGGAFNCFDCEEHGNPIELVAKMEEVKPIKAAQLIAEWFNITDCFYEKKFSSRNTRSGESKSSRDKTPARPKASEGASASDYGDEPSSPAVQGSQPEPNLHHNPPLSWPGLKNLVAEHDAVTAVGLMPDTVAEFGAGYCETGLMAGRLAVPIHNREGELLGYVGIDLDQERSDEQLFGDPKSDRLRWPPAEKYDPSLDLFNLHRAISSPAYEVEGLIIATDIIDVFELYERGHENVVAILGDQLSEQQALRLEALGKPLPFFTLWCGGNHTVAADAASRLARIGYVRLATPKERSFFDE